jgi:hypothetical protein
MKQRLLEIADYIDMNALDADRAYQALAHTVSMLLRALAVKDKGIPED